MKIKFYASIILLIGLLGSAEVSAQTAGDYRSFQSGDWNLTSTWESFNGATWDPASTTPTASDGVISIRNGHIVTIPNTANITANQINVDAGGNLTVALASTLELLDESGGDELTVNPGGGRGGTPGIAEIGGTLRALNGATVSASASHIVFQNEATYDHAYTTSAGGIPLATWNPGSTVLISGYTSNGTVPTGLNQTFHHFTWNTPNLNTGDPMIPFDLAGNLTTVKGNLTVSNTGANFLSISDAVNYSLTIEGNVLIENASEVYFAYSQLNAALNVLGNFTHTSSRIVGITDAADFTLDIDGDFTLNNSTGTFDFVTNFAGGSGNVIFNLGGNLNLNTGSFTKSSAAGVATLNFDGISPQIYSSSISVTAPINYSVASGSVLDLGTSALQGAGNFTLSDNAGLRLGSGALDGAWQNSITSGKGNILVGGIRTYGDFLNITYNGSAAQKTGLDFPETKNISLTIDNPTSVSLSENITIFGTESLTLTQGTLNIGSNTLSLNGTVEATNGNIGATTSSSLSIGGSGALGILPFASTSNTLNNFTLARTSTGSVTLGGDLSVLGTIAFTDGNLHLNGNSLTLQGGLTQTSGAIVSNNLSTLVIQGSGALGDIPFAANSEIGTLTMDRITSGSAGLAGNLLLTQNLNLNNGAFNNSSFLTMADNATITREAGGSLGSTPSAATSYNVTYSSSLTTGPELPSSSSTIATLRNLTVAASGTVTLNKNITTHGPLELANGTLDLATHTVTLKNNLVVNANLQPSTSTIVFDGISTISGTTAPVFNNVQLASGSTVTMNASTFTVAGNWENEGTLDPGSSTVTFNNNTTISGSVAPSFHNIELAGNLTAPSGNMNLSGNWNYTSGTFTPNGGTITFNGTSQNILSGNQAFYNLSTAGTGIKLLSGSLLVNNSLTIGTGSELDVSANVYPIEVKGHWINNGTFDPRTGKVLLSGTSLQTIDGSSITDFYDLEITNISSPVGSRALIDVTLTNSLTLGANAVFDPDGTDGTVNFHLSSNANSTAGIATLPTGASIDGSVVVERYIHAEGRIYRYIATPVTTAIVRDWNDNFTIRGNYSGATTTGNPTMYIYNEAVDGVGGNGWEAYPPSSGSITDALEVGTGYSAGMLNGGTIVATAKGPVMQGPLSLPLSYSVTATGTPEDDFGWNLVGNPYPSAIDWTKVAYDDTKVGTTIYIPDNGSGTLRYATYDKSGASTNGGSAHIASGQAFWVKAKETGQSLNFTENSKSSQSGTEFFRERPLENVLKIAVNQGSNRDEAVMVFRKNVRTDFDEHDGLKRKNSKLNFSTLSEDGKELTYNYWPLVSCNTDIKIKLETDKTGNYSIDFDYLETLPEDMIFELIDLYAKTQTTVEPGTTYSFEVNTDEASKGSERFILRSSSASLNTDLAVTTSDQCKSGPALITIIGAEKDVYYQLMYGEEAMSEALLSSGANLTFEVAQENLLEGENIFNIQASRGDCDAVDLFEKAIIQKSEIYEISGVTVASGCTAGNYTLGAEGAPEGGMYRWYSTEEGSSLLEETTSNEFITPEVNKTTYFWVTAVNLAGCESTRRVKVRVLIEESAEITGVKGASGCMGSSLKLKASTDDPTNYFRWYADAEGGDYLAETSETFSTPALGESTTYYVAAVTKDGCESAKRVAVMAEIITMEQPEILAEYTNLHIVNYVKGNIQWYFNGDAVKGANSSDFEAETAGIYTVSISKDNCMFVSEEYELMLTNGGNDQILDIIKFWPNPTQNELFVQLLPEVKGKVDIRLRSLNGVLLLKTKAISGSTSLLDLSEFASGIYILEIKSTGKTYRTRVSKLQ